MLPFKFSACGRPRARYAFIDVKWRHQREMGQKFQEDQRNAFGWPRSGKEREERKILEYLACIRLQGWMRGCIGRKLVLDMLHLNTQAKYALRIQASYRGLMGRRRAYAKNRMLYDSRLAKVWRQQQGFIMRSVGFKHRHQQRGGYTLLRPLGIKPISYDADKENLIREIQSDMRVAKQMVLREIEVLQTIWKRRTLKFSKTIRIKYSRAMDDAAGLTVSSHTAVRIIRCKEKRELVGRTGFVIRIDARYGLRGMCEILMDDDGSLQYVPAMTEGSATEAPANGCIRILKRDFHCMPQKIQKDWRRNVRLYADLCRSDRVIFVASQYIQRSQGDGLQGSSFAGFISTTKFRSWSETGS